MSAPYASMARSMLLEAQRQAPADRGLAGPGGRARSVDPPAGPGGVGRPRDVHRHARPDRRHVGYRGVGAADCSTKPT